MAAVKKATTAKKAPAKRTTKAVIKPRAKMPLVSPKIVTPHVQLEAEATVPSLGKKELIDAVVLRSGIKKKDAKPVIEAVLAVLGETIAVSKEMNLQPFGKLMVKKQVDKTSAVVSIVKIRQSKAAAKAKGLSSVSQAAE